VKISGFIEKYDTQNQFQVLIETYKQIDYAWRKKIDLENLVGKKFKNIIISGLGGSAEGGDLLLNFLKDDLLTPLFVNRNYALPNFADHDTLLIASSYSGNTEETISVLRSAIEKELKIVCLSTGGKIAEIAEKNHLPLVKLQEGFQPRYALGTSFFSLLKVFQLLNLIRPHDEIVNKIFEVWKNKGTEYSQEHNSALSYAKELIGFIPVIYSAADVTSAVGYRLKCQFNENSKMHAFHNVIPESNHNEIVGWETIDEFQFRTKIINIVDKDYHPHVTERFKIVSEIVSDKKIDIINLESKSEEFKVRLLDLIYLCDWITYYAAVLRGFDPSEIQNINLLKERLSQLHTDD
jgi:glucose/mannose-6-phosphate isomerase